jgi:hypothetical protein
VQRRREWAVRIVQAYQHVVQGWLLALQRGTPTARLPLSFRVVQHTPFVRNLAARTIGLGRSGSVRCPRLDLPPAAATTSNSAVRVAQIDSIDLPNRSWTSSRMRSFRGSRIGRVVRQTEVVMNNLASPPDVVTA